MNSLSDTALEKIISQSLASGDVTGSVIYLTLNKLGDNLNKAGNAVDELKPPLKSVLETIPPELSKTMAVVRYVGYGAIGFLAILALVKIFRRK
jgi:N-acetylmuramic acid 6-phosphate (MurNAc-6-P) etherase